MQLNIKNLTKGKLLIYSVIPIAIIFVLLISNIFSNSKYEILYQVGNNSEMPLIVQFLNKTGEDYIIQDNKVLVKSEDIRRLRMYLAAENIVSNTSIIGYEIFNKPDVLGSSSFTQNINLIRSLEGELSRTIMSFNNVHSARVHLVIPRREMFSVAQPKTSASVMLKLLGGRDLTNREISAISNLIASAVPNLDRNKVTIVSTDGKPYKVSTGDEEGDVMQSHLQEYKLDVEKRLKTSVENLIENVVGAGKVKAEVSADIDFDKLIIDSEQYNPDEQVLRSAQNVQDSSTESDKNTNVSVANNVVGSGDSESGGKNSNSQRSEETKNYEISKETRRYIKEIGTIKKLSIAVVVDGSYVKDDKSAEFVYKPVSEEALTNIRSLISSAVGFNKERGDVLEVINMNFSRNDQLSENIEESFIRIWIESNLMILIKIFVSFLLILIAMLFIVKPTIDKIFDERKAKREGEDKAVVDANQSQQEVIQPKDEMIKKLEEIVENGSNTIINVLRDLITKI